MNRWSNSVLLINALLCSGLLLRNPLPLILLVPLMIEIYGNHIRTRAALSPASAKAVFRHVDMTVSHDQSRVMYHFGEILVERTISPRRLAAGHSAEVRLTVTNGGLKRRVILLKDQYPQGTELKDGSNTLFGSLAPEEQLTISYRVGCIRGEHRWSAPEVSLKSIMGFHALDCPTDQDSRILALPPAPGRFRLPLRVRNTLVYAGNNPSGRGGDGIHFHDLRPYQAGDSLRHIHWRSMARHQDSLVTREFEQERISDIGLVVDAREDACNWMAGPEIIERLVEGAASMSSMLLAMQNRVGLVIYGHYLNFLPPGYGKVQLEKILRRLAELNPASHEAFKKLDAIPTRLFPERSQLIFLSGLMKGDETHYLRLKARGYDIMLIIPDSLQGDEAHIQLARLERSRQIRILERSGIKAMLWSRDLSLESMLDRNRHRLGSQRQVKI